MVPVVGGSGWNRSWGEIYKMSLRSRAPSTLFPVLFSLLGRLS